MDDYAAVIQALENAAKNPNWTLGSGHGCHPSTFVFLADELVRRASGAESLPEFWRERIAQPLKLDLWLGLPPSEEDARVAEIIAARANTPQNEFNRAFAEPGSLTRRAFASPRELHAVSDMKRPENWRAKHQSQADQQLALQVKQHRSEQRHQGRGRTVGHDSNDILLMYSASRP